jgi:hypothetical protein
MGMKMCASRMQIIYEQFLQLTEVWNAFSPRFKHVVTGFQLLDKKKKKKKKKKKEHPILPLCYTAVNFSIGSTTLREEKEMSHDLHDSIVIYRYFLVAVAICYYSTLHE